MFEAIFALFAWRTVRDTGVWQYQENSVTGKRRALAVMLDPGGYQPLDRQWLSGDDHAAALDNDLAKQWLAEQEGVKPMPVPGIVARDGAEFRPGETACSMADLAAYVGKINQAHDRAVRV